MKIMLVDDDRLIRHILKEMLSKIDCELVSYEDGKKALDAFPEEKPDVMIMDVEIPKMNGYQLAKEIRKLEQENNSTFKTWTPIIFLSSNLEDKYLEEGIKAGGDDYLKKPISKTVLLAKLKAMSRISNIQKNLQNKTTALEKANKKILEINEELEKLNSKNEYYATHDTLTGLTNRLLLSDRMEHELEISKRYEKKFSVLFLDLDDFKEANDKFGHEIGDQILITITDRIKSLVRESDTFSRIGGDEFVILLSDVHNNDGIKKVASSIISATETPIETPKGNAQIGMSIGISIYPDHGNTTQELLNNADCAMYDAKSKGKNCFSIFDSSFQANTSSQLVDKVTRSGE